MKSRCTRHQTALSTAFVAVTRPIGMQVPFPKTTCCTAIYPTCSPCLITAAIIFPAEVVKQDSAVSLSYPPHQLSLAAHMIAPSGSANVAYLDKQELWLQYVDFEEDYHTNSTPVTHDENWRTTLKTLGHLNKALIT